MGKKDQASSSGFQKSESQTNMKAPLKPLISKSYPLYKSFFQGQSHPNINDIFSYPYLEQLNKNKIWYSKQKFSAEMGIMVISNNQDWKIVNLLVSLSYFTFQLSLINKSEGSVFENCFNLANGGMGSIYLVSGHASQSKYIVKSVPHKANRPILNFDGNINIKQTAILKSTIKQYCINKLCSVLQIGPKVLNIFGFDLMVSDSSVDFALQQCKPLKIINISEFRYYIRVLHEFQIIHGDIKIDNLMWSPSFKKPVLIDFGLSQCLKQKPGQMTFTHFFGTVFYCSPEMKSLLNNGLDLVDLYYNDVYCLLRSIEISKNMNTLSEFKLSFQQMTLDEKRTVQTYVHNFKIMKQIYDRDLQSFEKVQKLKTKYEIFPETIQLFYELPSNQTLYKMVCIAEEMSILSMQTVDKLKLYHSGRRRLNVTASNKGSSFEKRIGQIVKANVPITGLMMYLMVFYHQDVTPGSKFRKLQLQKQLKAEKIIDRNFAYKLTEYILNLHTTEENIKEAFRLVYQMLREGQNKQQSLYQQAFKIAVLLEQKHSINLIRICKEVSSKSVARMKEYSDGLSDYQVEWLCQWVQTEKLKIYCGPGNQKFLGKVRNFYARKKGEENQRWRVRDINPYLQIGKKRDNEDNKLLVECSRIDSASKTFACQSKLQENFDDLNTSMEKYQFYREEMLKRCVNLCLNPQIVVFFNFFTFIQSNFLGPSFQLKQIEEGICKMKLFFRLFFSIEAFGKFSLTLTSKIRRFKHYKIYESSEMALKVVKMLKQFHEQVFFSNLFLLNQGQGLEPLTYTYQTFLAFTFLLDKHHFKKIITYFKTEEANLRFHQIKTNHNVLLRLTKIKSQLYLKFNILNMVGTISALRQIYLLFADAPSSIQLQYNHYALLYSIYAKQDKSSEYYASNVQTLFYSLPLQDKFQFLECSILSPYMQMYYSYQKFDYFHRAFRYLVSFMQVYNSFSQQCRQMQFVYYLFLRNSVWPYVNLNDILHIAKLFIQQTKQIRRKSFNKFLKQYGNLVVVFDMLLSSIYTFQLFRQGRNVVTQILRLMQQLLPHSSTLMRKNVLKKYYLIILKFQEEKVIQMSTERKVMFYKIKQFRNQQYPTFKKLNKSGQLYISKDPNKIRAKQIIQGKESKWNNNKKMSVRNLKSDIHSLPLSYFQFMINQRTIQQSVLCKQLDCGIPALYKNSQTFWHQISTTI